MAINGYDDLCDTKYYANEISKTKASVTSSFSSYLVILPIEKLKSAYFLKFNRAHRCMALFGIILDDVFL